MSMFTNARKFKISESQLTNITNHSYAPAQTGIDILLEVSTPEAAHDSSARDPPPRCFPGTREEFVEDIIQWAIPPAGTAPPPVYWMKGPAGVGKSAIAQTCVEKLKRQGTHFPAFFFSVNGRNNHQKFFPSIAHQLATINSDYHDLIDKKIRRNKTLVNKTMETQFWGLIVEPLQELEDSGKGIGERIVVFVDGLDECESQDAQCEIIEIVTSAAREGTAPLCWAFFSRPEPHIEATFSRADISVLCHTATLPISRDANGDIELYLRAGFENILRRLNITTIASLWPSNGDVKELVRAAGGLFIYAKTVLRFVGQAGTFNPEELLRVVMALVSSHSQRDPIAGSAFSELDAFYFLIMHRIPPKMFPIIYQILTVLCLSPQNSSAILFANTLGISRAELEAACNQMSAIVRFRRQHEPLQIDSTIDTSRSFLQTKQGLPLGAYFTIRNSLGGSISFFHKSFKDFLLDPHRSGIYCIYTRKDFLNHRLVELALQFETRHHWQGVELIRAPGTLESASILSYPYGSELVNSIIEAWIYRHIDGGNLVLGADFDFRKRLYINMYISRDLFPSRERVQVRMYQCAGFRKYVNRTQLFWIQADEFSTFDTTSFEKDIEKRRQRNIIQPYVSTSLSVSESQGLIETGLFTVGHGSKAIFWYWEINHDYKSYREFKTPDLAEGERLYREGQFD